MQFIALLTASLCLFSLSYVQAESSTSTMTTSTPHITLINPDNLYQSRYYTQAVRVQGGATLYVSGQWSYNPQGELVGKDNLEAQTLQTFQNLQAVLKAAKATPQDVVKINIYIVNYRPEYLSILEKGLQACFGEKRNFASTLIGVQALAREGMQIEAEAIAVTAQ